MRARRGTAARIGPWTHPSIRRGFPRLSRASAAMCARRPSSRPTAPTSGCADAARAQARAVAAFGLVQGARRVREPAAAANSARRRHGRLRRQPRRRGRVRGAGARHQGEDLRADRVVAREGRAHPPLRRRARRRRRPIRRCARRQRSMGKDIRLAAGACLRPGRNHARHRYARLREALEAAGFPVSTACWSRWAAAA